MTAIQKRRSMALTLAHAMQKRNPTLSFSEVQTQGWKVLRLTEKMREKQAKFTFRKVNGELREAIGTVDYALERTIVKRGKQKIPTIRYFDLTKNSDGQPKGWRSFRAELVQL